MRSLTIGSPQMASDPPRPAILRSDTNRREFLAATFALTASAGLFAAGCGGSSDSQTTTRLSKPSTKPESLTVRVYGGIFEQAFERGAGRSFTEETGIKLVFDRAPDAESFTQIQTAIRSGAEPPVDVSWNTSTNGYLSIKQDLLNRSTRRSSPTSAASTRRSRNPPTVRGAMSARMATQSRSTTARI